MGEVIPFRNQPVYRTVEVRHPEYPDDAPPLIAKIQRNLTHRQLDALRDAIYVLTPDGKKEVVKPGTTLKDAWRALAPYVIEWNHTAENDDGEWVPVPPPSDDPNAFATIDQFFFWTLVGMVRYSWIGGPPGSKEEAERKNSSAASEDSEQNSDVAKKQPAIHAVKNSSSDSKTDSPSNGTTKRGSRKTKTTSSTAASNGT